MDTATATLIAAVVASVAGVLTTAASGYFAYRQHEAVEQSRALTEKLAAADTKLDRLRERVELLRGQLAEERAAREAQP
jgi:hypothetical protein